MAEMARTFRLLNLEQRAAAVGAVLLAVSTFGPFSLVELAEVMVAAGVLALLRARALGKEFHLPFGDGTVIATAGAWAAALIVVRLFDRSLGQNLLALVCAAILVLAGVRERAKRPADDLPPEQRSGPPPGADRPARPPRPATPAADAPTEPLPPPEFKPYKPQEGEQLRLGGDEPTAQPPGDA
jgi:hypothetical protein